MRCRSALDENLFLEDDDAKKIAWEYGRRRAKNISASFWEVIRRKQVLLIFLKAYQESLAKFISGIAFEEMRGFLMLWIQKDKNYFKLVQTQRKASTSHPPQNSPRRIIFKNSTLSSPYSLQNPSHHSQEVFHIQTKGRPREPQSISVHGELLLSFVLAGSFPHFCGSLISCSI